MFVAEQCANKQISKRLRSGNPTKDIDRASQCVKSWALIATYSDYYRKLFNGVNVMHGNN